MDKIRIELTLEEVNAIIAVMAQLPFNQVHELVQKIRNQALEQLRAAQEAAAEAQQSNEPVPGSAE